MPGVRLLGQIGEIMDMNMNMPAGEYIIGDPGYIWPKDDWSGENGFLDRINSDKDGPLENVLIENGHKIAISSTYTGDGRYRSDFPGREVEANKHGVALSIIDENAQAFLVDSGLLGAIPVELVDPDLISSGQHYVHHFNEDWVFSPGDDALGDGMIGFGDRVINTGTDGRIFR